MTAGRRIEGSRRALTNRTLPLSLLLRSRRERFGLCRSRDSPCFLKKPPSFIRDDVVGGTDDSFREFVGRHCSRKALEPSGKNFLPVGVQIPPTKFVSDKDMPRIDERF